MTFDLRAVLKHEFSLPYILQLMKLNEGFRNKLVLVFNMDGRFHYPGYSQVLICNVLFPVSTTRTHRHFNAII